MVSTSFVKPRNFVGRARFLVRSHFGRTSGWRVEFEGQCVGELTDYRWADMFWDSYAVTQLGDDGPFTIFDAKNWAESKFVFRNRESGEVVTYAFCGDWRLT